MRHWLIKLLGGYSTIYDVLFAVDKRVDKKDLLTEAVKDLFNTISVEDILKEDPNTKLWRFKESEMSNDKKKLLIAEATNLLSSSLWKILKSDVLYQANLKMYIKSRTLDDLTMGKCWAYTFDAIETRLKSMKKGSGKYNTG